jgi:hypothetical protein
VSAPDVASLLARARRYVDDVRGGHVSFADEGIAVSQVLAGYLSDVLDVLEDQYVEQPSPGGAQERLRAELLAEVPASQRATGEHAGTDEAVAVATLLAGMPGDQAEIVTGWLRAARREVLPPAQLATVLAGLEDAATFRTERAGAYCVDCSECATELCDLHQGDLDAADAYRQVAHELEAGQ